MHRSILTLFVVAAMNACFPNPPQPEANKTIPVHVDHVKERDVQRYIEAIGVLRPITHVKIRPQVSGILLEAQFSEGQDVVKDQPLFVIDPLPYRIKLQEAEAQMQRDAAALEVIKKKLDRYEGLTKKELVSLQEWDELYAEAAKFAAQIKADEAKVAASALDLQCCYIVSPIAGKAGRIAFHPGSLILSSQAEALVPIACIEQLLVEFSVSEQQYLQLPSHYDKKIEIQSLYNPELTAEGTVTFSNFGFDSEGLLQMCGVIKNAEPNFLPGQGVKVRVPSEMDRGVILVPDKAVKINQQGPYVYCIGENGVAELRQVQTGGKFGKEVVIVEGLNKGELVVTEGHLRIYQGAIVEAVMHEHF